MQPPITPVLSVLLILLVPLPMHHHVILAIVLLANPSVEFALHVTQEKNHLVKHVLPAQMVLSQQELLHVPHVQLLDAQPVTLLAHVLIA